MDLLNGLGMWSRRIGVVGILFLLFFGCASKKVLPPPMAFQGECLRGLTFPESDRQSLQATPTHLQLAARYDERFLAIAQALGLGDELLRLSAGDFLGFQQRAAWEAKVNRRILKMTLELQALTAAIDCEEEKAEQIASFLERRLRKNERNLTVGAIVTGALVGIGSGLALASGGISNDWAEVIGITGGLIEVFLGVSILRLERQIEIEHPRNLLRDMHAAEERPDYVPPSIWFYFNYAGVQDAGNKSLREQLVERWETYNLALSGATVLLSDGGLYTPALLQQRADMLDQLESQLSLIHKDLLHFLGVMEGLLLSENQKAF
ncbi:MAG: hypothetical protein ACXIT9_09980 [Nitritalea sp.]